MTDADREVFRHNYMLVRDHLEDVPDDERVAVQTGPFVDEATPTIVNARELRDALNAYLDEDVATDEGSDPDYLTPEDVDDEIVEDVAEEYDVEVGDVLAELWGHPDNAVDRPAERAAVEARRRERRDVATDGGRDDVSENFLTRKCVACGHKVQQPKDDTAPTFCTCQDDGPQMVPPPYPEDEGLTDGPAETDGGRDVEDLETVRERHARRDGRDDNPDDPPAIACDGGTSRGESDRPPFIDPQTDWVECYLCGQVMTDMSRVDGMDISEPDEYYPKMVPVCPGHDTGSDPDA